MNSDDFEKRLERQTIRPIPGEWRRDILQNSKLVAAEVTRLKHPSLSQNDAKKIRASSPRLLLLKKALSELLWPCPQAWAGLAAVWLVILTLNFAMHEPEIKMAKTEPPSPEVIAVLQEQRRLYLELAGLQIKEPAEPPKTVTPGPSSQRKIEFQIV